MIEAGGGTVNILYADGTSAILNLQPFADRTLVAERKGKRTPFALPARGVALFDAAGETCGGLGTTARPSGHAGRVTLPSGQARRELCYNMYFTTGDSP